MIPKQNALIAGPHVVAGKELRKFTAGSWIACEEMGLSLIMNGDDGSVSQAEKILQVVAFVTIQTMDAEELGRLTKSKEAFWSKVRELSFDFPFAELSNAVRVIKRIKDDADDAAVQVLPKPGETAEDAPPNS